MTEAYHIPVLLQKTIELLKVKKDGVYVDATIGGGGHGQAILEKGGRLIGIDCDPEAIEFTRKRLTQACPIPQVGQQAIAGSLGAFRWILFKDNFANLGKIVRSLKIEKVEGILFDLGVSSHQLETPDRGFSFNTEADLDMRMDPELKVTAVDLVNGLNEGELYELFNKLGEEHFSRAIARALCRARRIKPIKTCDELAKIVVQTVPRRGKHDRTHPATRIFQALRIAVNDELNNLKAALPQTIDLLSQGGRLVVLSFHSLEDQIVKDFLKDQEAKGIFKNLLKRPETPSRQEVKINNRGRSAKLRAVERL